MCGAEDEVAVLICGSIGAVGEFLRCDVAGSVGIARGRRGALGVLRRRSCLGEGRCGECSKADQRYKSGGARDEMHADIVQHGGGCGGTSARVVRGGID